MVCQCLPKAPTLLSLRHRSRPLLMKHAHLFPLFVVLTVACLGMPTLSHAGEELIVPTSLVRSPLSQHTDEAGYDISHLTDGSGLSVVPTLANFSTVTHDPVTSANAWVTVAQGGVDEDSYSTGSSPRLNALFPSVRYHKGIVIWGYHFSGTNGNEAKDFTVFFSTDGGTSFVGSETVTSVTPLGAGAARLDFAVPHTANFIDIRISDNHFDSGTSEGSGHRVGLGEFRFIVGDEKVVTNASGDNSSGSLRQVIADSSPGDVIVFASALSGQTIILDGAQITLNKNLTIDASALARGITIDGGGSSRIFEINSGNTVVLHNLTLTGGHSAAGTGGGGAILNKGHLTLNDTTLSGNSTANYGGGINNVGGALALNQSTLHRNASTLDGGGLIHHAGTLTVTQSTIAENTARNGGGLFIQAGTTTITRSTFSGNAASGIAGGGIYINSGSTLNLSNSIVAANTAPNAADLFKNGSIFASGLNLIGDNSDSGFAEVPGLIGTSANPIDPKLSPLGWYGGPGEGGDVHKACWIRSFNGLSGGCLPGME